MIQIPARHTIPSGLVTLADHELHARTQLDDNAWAYFSGGAADEISLRANRSAWDALPLWPRVLRPLAGGHTRVPLLGRTLAHPILLAPVAFQRMAHPDGELAMAYAAAALGAGVVLSTQASVSLESVAQAVLPDPGRGPLWFQLYLQPDRGFTQALVQRAEAAGYEALVLTVDAPTSGVRDRERRAGFRLPPGVGPVNLTGLQVPAPSALSPGQSALFDGRTGTATALPRVVQAVGGAVPVLVDGGIRRGTDVLKAMALGASAVLVGRPAVWGLANAGAAGVAHVLRLLRDELEVAMALTGCATLAEATPALLEGQDGAPSGPG